MLILINGAKRAGKDELAKALYKTIQERGDTAKISSFALPMKNIIAQVFGISDKKLDYFKNNEEVKIGFRSPSESLCTGTTVRKALQIFGTDAMKPYFGNTVWGDLLLKDYEGYTDTVFLVPDFRYPDELQPLLDNDCGIVTIHIQRDLASNSGDTHSSETALKDFKFDYYITNNGTLEELEEKAKDLVKKARDLVKTI